MLHATITQRLGAWNRWWQSTPNPTRHRAAGGKLADVRDLLRPDFAARFRERFADPAACLSPRKRWELCWLAQQHHELTAGCPVAAMLGLGVGFEPLIYHFAHLSARVVATDLYAAESVWKTARCQVESVLTRNPFPYPRERLTVRNMDMRRLDVPAESFDVVWSCSSVEHMSSLAEFIQVFREIHRVLKPGGFALITTEYSLDEPYFLPGVLSLWPGCGLFTEKLAGLTLVGPVDLRHHDEVVGNRTTQRGTAMRRCLPEDLLGRPSGLCIATGYTRLIPVALALQKTDAAFAWPELLNAPGWYRPFCLGLEALRGRAEADEAVRHFSAALGQAELPGARLHCYRQLIESHVHAGQVASLHAALDEFAAVLPELPADDDALDLIAGVAAGQGQLALARRCWERAQGSCAALPVSRLRMRCHQLAAELAANGPCSEAAYLSALADAAWCEAQAFHGPEDPAVAALARQLSQLRGAHSLSSLLALAG